MWAVPQGSNQSHAQLRKNPALRAGKKQGLLDCCRHLCRLHNFWVTDEAASGMLR